MIKSLSYVGFSSPAASEWRRFAPEILGLQDVSDPSEEVTRLRMDDAPWRIAVHVGKTNALEYVGWDVGDHDGFEAVASALGDMVLTCMLRMWALQMNVGECARVV